MLLSSYSAPSHAKICRIRNHLGWEYIDLEFNGCCKCLGDLSALGMILWLREIQGLIEKNFFLQTFKTLYDPVACCLNPRTLFETLLTISFQIVYILRCSLRWDACCTAHREFERPLLQEETKGAEISSSSTRFRGNSSILVYPSCLILFWHRRNVVAALVMASIM